MESGRRIDGNPLGRIRAAGAPLRRGPLANNKRLHSFGEACYPRIRSMDRERQHVCAPPRMRQHISLALSLWLSSQSLIFCVCVSTDGCSFAMNVKFANTMDRFAVVRKILFVHQ
jgi:hypothetical protein